MSDGAKKNLGEHVKLLGILHLTLGGLCLVVALLVLFLFGGLATVVGLASQHDPDARVGMAVLGLIGTFVFGVLGVLSIPGFVAGYGLLQRRPWARVVGIVVSALALLNVPLGTLVGIYGLWVLADPSSEAVFQPPTSGPPAERPQGS